MEKSLYKLLGEYNAIAAVNDGLLGHLVADQQLGRYFMCHKKKEDVFADVSGL